MKLKKNIATSEAGFVFNPATGDSFAANPIGAEVLRRLQNGLSVEAITTELLGKYEVSVSQLQRDIDDFLLQLVSFQLLEE